LRNEAIDAIAKGGCAELKIRRDEHRRLLVGHLRYVIQT